MQKNMCDSIQDEKITRRRCCHAALVAAKEDEEAVTVFAFMQQT